MGKAKRDMEYQAVDADDPVWTFKDGGASTKSVYESKGTLLTAGGQSTSSGWTFVLSSSTCLLMGLWANTTMNLPPIVTGLSQATTAAVVAYTIAGAVPAIGQLLPGPMARRCASLSVFVQTSTDMGKILVDWQTVPLT